MEHYPDIAYRIALATYKNVNLGVARTIAERGISPEEFFTLPLADLQVRSGINARTLRDNSRAEALQAALRELDFMEKHNVKAVLWDDEAFPNRMKQCDDAPAILFVGGNPKFDYKHIVSIVGTRRCSAYGADICRQLVTELASKLDDLLIVSGLAYGIDIAAHRAALAAGVPTGAILAHGLNTLYPAEHRSEARAMMRANGFIATEYTANSPIHRGQFLARNRIVAALADVVIIVESDIKGGAMATARIANAYSREVCAVPGRLTDKYSRGTNSLIYNNEATLIRDADDIIACCRWTPKPKEGQQQTLDFELNPDQQRIINALRRNPDNTVNELSIALDIPVSKLSGILFEMEMDSLIVAIPGGRYCIIDANL